MILGREGDLSKELEDYRTQLQWTVDAGYLTAEEAEEAADSIRCVVHLCRRGHITQRMAEHLIDTMAAKCADALVRASAAGVAH